MPQASGSAGLQDIRTFAVFLGAKNTTFLKNRILYNFSRSVAGIDT